MWCVRPRPGAARPCYPPNGLAPCAPCTDVPRASTLFPHHARKISTARRTAPAAARRPRSPPAGISLMWRPILSVSLAD
eukprot:590885-Prorocentrum_minimum.AAC.1